MVQRVCVRDKSVMEGGWRAGEAGQGVGKRWCAHPHSCPPRKVSLRKVSLLRRDAQKAEGGRDLDVLHQRPRTF